MSDTKLDDETERLIDEYGTAEFWNGRFMDNGGTPKAEALAALRDRVRELVQQARAELEGEVEILERNVTAATDKWLAATGEIIRLQDHEKARIRGQALLGASGEAA